MIAAPRAGCHAPAPQPGVNPLPLTTRPEGVIASVVTSESGCGSHVAPWRLHALPGQRFNVTLVDFAHALTTGSSSAERRACYAYAVFKETGKSFTLCGSVAGERETVAYVSTTEKLTVSVISRTDSEIPRNFLLKYNGTYYRGYGNGTQSQMLNKMKAKICYSLPSHLVNSSTENSFKNKLCSFWSNQEVYLVTLDVTYRNRKQKYNCKSVRVRTD